MTFLEFGYAMDGFNELETERRDQEAFDHRRLCFHAIAMHRAPDSNIKGPKDLWPHKWDEQIEIERLKQTPIISVSVDE